MSLCYNSSGVRRIFTFCRIKIVNGIGAIKMNIFYFKVALLCLFSVFTYVGVIVRNFSIKDSRVVDKVSYIAYAWVLSGLAITYGVTSRGIEDNRLILYLLNAFFALMVIRILYRMNAIIRQYKDEKHDFVYLTGYAAIGALIIEVLSRNVINSFSSITLFLLIVLSVIFVYLVFFKKQDNYYIAKLFLLLGILISAYGIYLDKGIGIFDFAIMLLAFTMSIIGLVITYFDIFHEILRKNSNNLSKKDKKLTEAEIKIIQLAYVDQITEMPNYVSFQKDFEDLNLSEESRYLLLINLDNFKKVNNIIGFTRGNDYLKKVADILNCQKGYADKAYHFNGDQFAIIHRGDEKSAGLLAGRILESLNHSQDLLVLHYNMSASIGIGQIAEDKCYNTLMKEVEVALSEVKSKGKNNYLFYDEELDIMHEKVLQIESRLEHAIENDEIFMYFQPQVNTRTKEVVGLEALVRWKNSDGVMIPPDVFIPIAERTGQMVRISEFIMDKSIEALKKLERFGYGNITMSINISPVEIFDEFFVEKLLLIIKKHGVNSKNLIIEITENSLIENLEGASNILNMLRNNNIAISLDDFGVGYSSLNYFSKLPIDEVKFDKSFTDDIESSEKSRVILKHFTEIAHTLGMQVVIEGVENLTQLDIASEVSCDIYQGYYFSKPIPFEDLLTLLRNHTRKIDNEGIEIS